MYKKFCKTCGKELYISETPVDSNKYWCPFCFGLKSLETDEAINLCEKYSREIRKKALESAQSFSKNYLLVHALLVREMESRKIKNGENNRILYIIWSSLLINDCLKGNYSTDSVKQSTDENLFELFSYYNAVVESENLFVKVKERYFDLFEVNHEISPKIKRLNRLHETLEIEGKTYVAFPAQNWRYYDEMMQTINMSPDTSFEKTKDKIKNKAYERQKKEDEIRSLMRVSAGKKQIKLEKKLMEIQKLSIAEFVESCYNSFHASYYNKDFFSFEDISKDTKILDFFDLITKRSIDRIENLPTQLGEEQILYRIEISEFKNNCILMNLDFAEIKRTLVSSEDNRKGFPLFVEYENSILVCPHTLFLISNFIKFGIDKKNYKSDSKLLGDDFEKEVQTIFEGSVLIFL